MKIPTDRNVFACAGEGGRYGFDSAILIPAGDETLVACTDGCTMSLAFAERPLGEVDEHTVTYADGRTETVRTQTETPGPAAVNAAKLRKLKARELTVRRDCEIVARIPNDKILIPQDSCRFPNIRELMEDFCKIADQPETTVVTLDAKLLRKLASAISADGAVTLWIEPNSGRMLVGGPFGCGALAPCDMIDYRAVIDRAIEYCPQATVFPVEVAE